MKKIDLDTHKISRCAEISYERRTDLIEIRRTPPPFEFHRCLKALPEPDEVEETLGWYPYTHVVHWWDEDGDYAILDYQTHWLIELNPR